MQNTPHKKPRSSSKKSKQSKQPHIPTKLIVVLTTIATIIVLIIGAVAINSFKDNKHAKEGMRKMQTYLQNKYKKEFVVKNYRIEGAGLGVEGDPTADAYPKDNPDIKFKVWDYGRPVVGPHSYDDGYLNVVWGREYGQKIDKKVLDVVGTGARYELWVGVDDRLPLKIDFARGVPKFSQYNDSPGVSAGLSVYSSKKLTIQEVWSLLDILKQGNIPEVYLHACTEDRKDCYNFSNEEIDKFTSIQQLEAHINKLERY